MWSRGCSVPNASWATRPMADTWAEFCMRGEVLSVDVVFRGMLAVPLPHVG